MLSIQRMTKLIPGFAPIINAMVHLNSSQRISMAEAYQRFRALVDTLSDQILHEPIDTTFIGYLKRVPETSAELESLLKLSKNMS